MTPLIYILYLIQAGTTACTLGDMDFLEDVRACRPLELLEAYILKLCGFLYSEGQGSNVNASYESDDIDELPAAELHNSKDSTTLQANHEIRRVKVRCLLRQLEGRASSSMAVQLLEKASWDVERAAGLARSDPNWASAESADDAAGDKASTARVEAAKYAGGDIPANATAKAEELVQKLYKTIRTEDALWLLRMQAWDFDKAYEYSLHLQKSQTLADLLSMVKEFVFIGENRLAATIPKKIITQDVDSSVAPAVATSAARAEAELTAQAAEMERLPGRRVRDEKGFLLLCDLWDRVTDDSFRIQILDLALETYGEHPLNFFSLQDAQLLPKAMRALDVLSPQLRERTLKVLEYVVTVADCGLPLGDLCLMSSCLDSIWGSRPLDFALFV